MVRSSVLVLLSMLWASTIANGFEVVGEISGENDGDQYGSAICAVDFNGDGYLDMAVSAPANDAAGLSSGKVYLYFGGPSADTAADLILVGDASSFFGKSLSSAGDFNNDGYEDLLVGAPFYDVPATSAGAVYLFYGGPSADAVADHIFTGENGGDYFGIAVAGVGDFNNDSYDDFAVGAYYNDWGSFTKAGKVYVYYGGPSPDFVHDLTLVGTADGERFGFALSSQDYDGDSYSDLAVGAYSYDAAYLNQGRVYVFSGGSSVDTIPDLMITGDSAGYKFGWSLASGKVSGDSYWDLVMGSDGVAIDTFSTGGVFVFNGGPGFDNSADYSYNLGRLKHDYLGFDVASSADLNGDGFDEIIAGMPGNDDGGTDAGGALLFDGGSSVVVDTSFLGTSSDQEMGKAVGFWEDFGTSGTVVIAMGASSFDNYRGSLLLYQQSGGSENAPPVLATIGPQSTSENLNLNFGTSASDADGDTPLLSYSSLPGTATYVDNGNGTGTFDWTPTYIDSGTYQVTFYAADSAFPSVIDSEIVIITVTNVNQSPVLATIGSQSTSENLNLNFGTSASDADGDTPLLSYSTLPGTATYVDNGNGTGTFDWTPNYSDSGDHQVTFYAADSAFPSVIDSEIVTITVFNVNQAPVLDPIGPVTGVVGTLLNFTVTSSDPDGDIPDLSSSALPGTATYVDNGNGTGTFSWTPTNSDSGTYLVTFYAADLVFPAVIDSETVTITIADSSGCCILRGNVDHSPSGQIDISDLVYLVDFMFTGGPVPECFDEGDVNASGVAPMDISDLVFLVDYMFTGGPLPGACP